MIGVGTTIPLFCKPYLKLITEHLAYVINFPLVKNSVLRCMDKVKVCKMLSLIYEGQGEGGYKDIPKSLVVHVQKEII